MQEPMRRHANFTLITECVIPTVHVDSLTHRVFKFSFQRWAVWPWNNKVRGNFRRSAFLFCWAVITQASSTAATLPWQPMSVVYAPVANVVELATQTCQSLWGLFQIVFTSIIVFFFLFFFPVVQNALNGSELNHTKTLLHTIDLLNYCFSIKKNG